MISHLSKIGIRIFYFLGFVTFFACPKKVTKEKTPKSNSRDGSLTLTTDFSPLAQHSSLLLKSKRTPSPSPHICCDFGSLRTNHNLDSIMGAYSNVATEISLISIVFNVFIPKINLSWTAVQ